VLVVSDEDYIGDALSGLPLVYHLAATESRMGAPLYALFRNRGVFGLIPQRIRRHVTLIEGLDDLFEVRPRLVEQRVVHLATEPCRIRYGHRYHVMHAHFVNHGIYPERWEPPTLEFSSSAEVPVFDVLISPYYRGVLDEERTWPYERWQEVVDRLAGSLRVGVLATPADPRPFRNVEYYVGDQVEDVCAVMSSTRVGVLSIDNDFSHLAHALRVPHFLLYPATQSPVWSANTNPNAQRVIASPRDVSSDDVLEAMGPLLNA
jgi:hypothetical protein